MYTSFRKSETEAGHISIRKCAMPIGQGNEDSSFVQYDAFGIFQLVSVSEMSVIGGIFIIATIRVSNCRENFPVKF